MYASDLKHPNQTLESKLRRLYALQRGQHLELGFRQQYLDLLEKFGNPHERLPPTIHIAGTNGKGSTLAFMRSALEAAGYSVHSYTSPHLIRFNERIQIAGQPIDDQRLEALIDEALEHNGEGDISFFEITTAIAFAAFARNPADIALLEVGMGGRLDCTNVIPAPAACVITPISMDHSEYLGASLPLIAAEKAGIIKPCAPVITAPQAPAAMDILWSKAKEVDAPLYQSAPSAAALYKLCLDGAHQQENAATAITALDTFKKEFPISEENLAKGLADASWPARLQELNAADLGLKPDKWEIWLDGGHNEAAGQALAAKAAQWRADNPDKKLHLVIAMMKHKDAAAFLTPLLSHSDYLHITALAGEAQAMDISSLHKKVDHIKLAAEPQSHESWQNALSTIAAQTPEGGRVLITGSLYLAGDVLKALY